MGNRRALAAQVIAEASSGALRPGLLEALAGAVLADAPEDVRLAMEVLAGGEHAVRRAIELAALVLASAAMASSTEKA